MAGAQIVSIHQLLQNWETLQKNIETWENYTAFWFWLHMETPILNSEPLKRRAIPFHFTMNSQLCVSIQRVRFASWIRCFLAFLHAVVFVPVTVPQLSPGLTQQETFLEDINNILNTGEVAHGWWWWCWIMIDALHVLWQGPILVDCHGVSWTRRVTTFCWLVQVKKSDEFHGLRQLFFPVFRSIQKHPSESAMIRAWANTIIIHHFAVYPLAPSLQ